MSMVTPTQNTLPIGGFEAYVRRAFAAPMLTEAQEQDLARRYHEHEDIEAAKQLVFSHVRFVVHLAKSYHLGFGIPWSDLVQEGSVGLMKAVKRFDPNRGVRFAAFAVHWIKAEMHDYVCKNWRMVKTFTTKTHRSLLLKKHKIMQRLDGKRSLSDTDRTFLAEALGVDKDALLDMEARLAGCDLPFDGPANANDEEAMPALAGTIADNQYAPALLHEDFDWNQQQKAALRTALASMDERSQAIVQQRWLQTPKASLSDLAAVYNVSIERIRQIEKNAFKKLKAALTDQ